MTKSRSIYLSALASCVLVLTILAYLPATVYSGGAAEFSWPLIYLLSEYAPWAAAIFAGEVLVAALLPRRASWVWASLVTILAAVVWAHGSLPIISMPLLDGQTWDTSVAPREVAIDVAFIGLVAAGTLLLVIKSKGAAFRLMFGLAAILIVQTAIVVSGDDKSAVAAAPVDDGIFQFSAEKNVLVVLLDGMQSDVFEEVAQGRELEGFTFYPDTAGVSTTTYLAMPTIHSGNVYDGRKPLREVYKEWVVDGSFMSSLAESGYRSTMINAVMGTCPGGISECYTAGAVIGGPEQQRRSEAARLVDVSLLRIVPVMFRDAVYNNGNWIIGQHVQEPESRHFAVEGNAVLNRFAASLSAESDRPTAKFMHLFNTHLPVVMNEDCTYVGETVEFGRATFKAQVSCAVDRLESLFASMKEAGVYDRTAIVVLSDHGTTGLGSSKSKGEGEISTGLIGVANPTLAFKALGASGAFSTSTQPMSLSDVAGLICGNMGDCIAPERTGDRFFNRYTWSAEYWNSDTLPDLTQFRISGSVWNPRAWERVSK